MATTIIYNLDDLSLPAQQASQQASDSPTSLLTLTRRRGRPQAGPDDEVLPVAAAFVPDEDGARELRTQANPWPASPYLYDEFGTSLANFALEQEEPWTAQAQAVVWTSRPFRDDDIYPTTAPAAALESDDGVFLLPPPWPLWSAATVPVQSASGAILSIALDQEENWTAQVQSIPWNPRPFRDDEISTSLTNFAREQEEPWVGLFQRVPLLAAPFRDDEVYPGATVVAVESEDAFVAQVQPTPWTPRPFADDEVGTSLANFAREQEEPWVARVQVILWTPLAFSDDELWVPPPANPWIDDDPPYVARVVYLPWTPVPFRDDEISTSLANFAREQEDYWPPRVLLQPWTPLVFSDEDPLSRPSPVEDEQPYVARVQSIPWTPTPFRDDDIRVTPPAFEDEQPFVARVQYVVWTPRSFTYDEISTQLANFAREQEDDFRLSGRNAVVMAPWTPVVFTDTDTLWFVSGGVVIVFTGQAGVFDFTGRPEDFDFTGRPKDFDFTGKP